MVAGTLAFCGKGLVGAVAADTEQEIPRGEVEKLVKKWMPLDPKNRGSLKEIMRDPLLNMGQEEITASCPVRTWIPG